MKYRMMFVIILSALLTLYFGSCTSPSSSRTTPQVFSFANVWFSNPQDMDGDGYVVSAHLNFDVDVSRGSKDVIAIVGVRIHDPDDAADYYIYTESIPFPVEGSGSDDAVYLIEQLTPTPLAVDPVHRKGE